ncbi:PC4 domain-containing protein [Trichonephila clavipes]|nr:PC4 domain-containing protein [Trichonephila clavipes]
MRRLEKEKRGGDLKGEVEEKSSEKTRADRLRKRRGESQSFLLGDADQESEARMSKNALRTGRRQAVDEDTKSDSSFSEDTIPPHHFHLGQDVYAAVTYFATMVQVHLRLYKRDGNNRLFPTKRGVCFSPMLWQSFVNQIEQINTSSSVEETILIKDSLMISTVFY